MLGVFCRGTASLHENMQDFDQFLLAKRIRANQFNHQQNEPRYEDLTPKGEEETLVKAKIVLQTMIIFTLYIILFNLSIIFLH